MTKQTEALKLALEALEKSTRYFNIVRLGESRLKDTEIRCASHAAITAIKEALATDYRPVKTYHEGKPVYVSQPEQEPYGYVWLDTANFRKKITPTGESEAWNAVYTTPPQRTWVGLTDVQKSLDNAPPHFDRSQASAWQDGVYWAEAKLKEKNT